MKKLNLTLIILLFSFSAFGQSPWSFDNDILEEEALETKLVPFEYPDNLDNGIYNRFGMNQLSESTESFLIIENEIIGRFLVGAGCNSTFSFLIIGFYNLTIEKYFPLSSFWLSEEYRKTILAHNNVDSHNRIYDFKFKSDEIRLTEINDDDLAEFHDKKRLDYIRMISAKSEAKLELTKNIRHNYFFAGKTLNFILPTILLNNIDVYLGLQSNVSTDIDDEINKLNEKENKISERDVTGPEYTSWVYELFNKDKDYSERGIHESGEGYDRYIKYSDLNEQEQKYLKKVRNVMLFNFASPQMLGINRFEIINNDNLFYNFLFMSYLTPFGYCVDFDLMIKIRSFNLLITEHTYGNYNNHFPGLDVNIYRFSKEIAGKIFYFTTTASIWTQPKDLEFMQNESELGGMFRFETIIPLSNYFEIFTAAGYKTDGWVAGELSLENEFKFYTGMNFLLY